MLTMTLCAHLPSLFYPLGGREVAKRKDLKKRPRDEGERAGARRSERALNARKKAFLGERRGGTPPLWAPFSFVLHVESRSC